MKNKFGFVLVKPQLGENIGAVARSLKNFGFSKLNLVTPKFTFPNQKTKVTSVGAFDLINSAKVFDNIEKAISEFDVVISLSARRRDINKKHITLIDLNNILKKRNNSSFGFMFGPENSGLSNKDISLSNFILQIPTSKKFKSLNLSHSVTIICYELFKFLKDDLFLSVCRLPKFCLIGFTDVFVFGFGDGFSFLSLLTEVDLFLSSSTFWIGTVFCGAGFAS